MGGTCKTFRYFYSKLVNNVDSFHKCSHFIGQCNNLRSKFGNLQHDIHGIFFLNGFGDYKQHHTKLLST